MNTIELTNEQSRCVLNLLIAENLGIQLKTPILLTSKCNVWDNVFQLSKKYNQSFVTNVTTTLVNVKKQTVYEISSLDMLRELVEDYDCYLVFNL